MKDFVPKPGRLMDQVREVMRFYHYAYSTEKSYIYWILEYIHFNNRRHPSEMGKLEIERFLSNLAINKHVSASNQNHAINAILFLYRDILKSPSRSNLTHCVQNGTNACRPYYLHINPVIICFCSA